MNPYFIKKGDGEPRTYFPVPEENQKEVLIHGRVQGRALASRRILILLDRPADLTYAIYRLINVQEKAIHKREVLREQQQLELDLRAESFRLSQSSKLPLLPVFFPLYLHLSEESIPTWEARVSEFRKQFSNTQRRVGVPELLKTKQRYNEPVMEFTARHDLSSILLPQTFPLRDSTTCALKTHDVEAHLSKRRRPTKDLKNGFLSLGSQGSCVGLSLVPCSPVAFLFISLTGWRNVHDTEQLQFITNLEFNNYWVKPKPYSFPSIGTGNRSLDPMQLETHSLTRWVGVSKVAPAASVGVTTYLLTRRLGLLPSRRHPKLENHQPSHKETTKLYAAERETPESVRTTIFEPEGEVLHRRVRKGPGLGRDAANESPPTGHSTSLAGPLLLLLKLCAQVIWEGVKPPPAPYSGDGAREFELLTKDFLDTKKSPTPRIVSHSVHRFGLVKIALERSREELYIPGPRMMVATPRASTNKRNGSCKGRDKAAIALARLFMARLAGNENKRKNPTGNEYFELFFMEFFQLSRKIGCNITQSPIYLFLARKTNRCLCPAHTDFILAVVGPTTLLLSFEISYEKKVDKKNNFKTGIVVQSVRAPPCQGGSCGFEPRQSRPSHNCVLRPGLATKGSNTKACILYVFECGEYGHRIELCPKQNQTDVENSPAAKEVLPNPDPQVGSEQRPFGPWMLPPNRRRKRTTWEPEARCVRTGEKSAVFQPSGKKTLSASRSTFSDTIPFYRFAALRHVAEEDSRTHARSLGRYFFLKISTNHPLVVFHDRTIGLIPSIGGHLGSKISMSLMPLGTLKGRIDRNWSDRSRLISSIPLSGLRSLVESLKAKSCFFRTGRDPQSYDTMNGKETDPPLFESLVEEELADVEGESKSRSAQRLALETLSLTSPIKLSAWIFLQRNSSGESLQLRMGPTLLNHRSRESPLIREGVVRNAGKQEKKKKQFMGEVTASKPGVQVERGRTGSHEYERKQFMGERKDDAIQLWD
ncbi:hypothetical protein AXX17_ATUG03930 (mitochondrion) [Arabidopsis thaliana]|uniref:Uncharacterized protein n=1 Tax=Arabidopsis thaliana TaxID=3702 RepID=A0A178U683_ARATH|nr:hypothetical protein AXX17_ATUG03930 [Arabidopsis thaliana]